MVESKIWQVSLFMVLDIMPLKSDFGGEFVNAGNCIRENWYMTCHLLCYFWLKRREKEAWSTYKLISNFQWKRSCFGLFKEKASDSLLEYIINSRRKRLAKIQWLMPTIITILALPSHKSNNIYRIKKRRGNWLNDENSLSRCLGTMLYPLLSTKHESWKIN